MKYLFLPLILCAVQAQASLSSDARALEKLFGSMRGDSYSVHKGSALSMVKEYIRKKYKGDKESYEAYKFLQNAPGMQTDEQVAGTLTHQTAVSNVIDTIRYNYPKELVEKQVGKARHLMESLIEEGAEFGFDGFEQNGCAAPSPFLLVIEKEKGRVSGFELEPCQE